MEAFLRLLHEAGPFGYLWWQKRTHCFPVGKLPPRPPSGVDVYFGVNPVVTWLPANIRGGEAGVAAMHALYADYDAKDLVPYEGVDLGVYEQRVRNTTPQAAHLSPAAITNMAIKAYQTERFAENRLKYLSQLSKKLPSLMPFTPTFLVRTGGGVHVYWRLVDPFIFASQDDRAQGKALLRGWVRAVGADLAAASLDRVLRLPGTFNYKYDPSVEVKLLHSNDVAYTRAQFQAVIDARLSQAPVKPIRAVPEAVATRAAQHATHEARRRQDDTPVWDVFNQRYSVVQILERNGYEPRGRDRYARPGGMSASVVVLDEGRKSYHHSSSDLLFWGNYDGHALDAYDLFVELEHAGDRAAAAKAAREILGLMGARFTDGEAGIYRIADQMIGVPLTIAPPEKSRVFRDDEL